MPFAGLRSHRMTNRRRAVPTPPGADGTAHAADGDKVAEVAWVPLLEISQFIPYALFKPVQRHLDAPSLLTTATRMGRLGAPHRRLRRSCTACGGNRTGEGVVTCAQDLPRTFHRRIAHPGRMRHRDGRSRRRSGGQHCPSWATRLDEAAGRSDCSSAKSAKGQHSSDQTRLQPATHETRPSAPMCSRAASGALPCEPKIGGPGVSTTPSPPQYKSAGQRTLPRGFRCVGGSSGAGSGGPS